MQREFLVFDDSGRDITARLGRNQRLVFATEGTESTEKNKANEAKKNRGNQTFIHRFLRFTQIITDSVTIREIRGCLNRFGWYR